MVLSSLLISPFVRKLSILFITAQCCDCVDLFIFIFVVVIFARRSCWFLAGRQTQNFQRRSLLFCCSLRAFCFLILFLSISCLVKSNALRVQHFQCALYYPCFYGIDLLIFRVVITSILFVIDVIILWLNLNTHSCHISSSCGYSPSLFSAMLIAASCWSSSCCGSSLTLGSICFELSSSASWTAVEEDETLLGLSVQCSPLLWVEVHLKCIQNRWNS